MTSSAHVRVLLHYKLLFGSQTVKQYSRIIPKKKTEFRTQLTADREGVGCQKLRLFLPN